MNTKILTVYESSKSAVSHPTIKLQGNLLDEYGFSAETLVMGEHSNGQAVFRAVGKGIEVYNKVVGDVREKDACLIQIFSVLQHGKYYPVLMVSGKWLTDAGFCIGDVISVRYGKDTITVKKIE